MGYDKIPRQKLSITKKNKEWREACVEAFIDLSDSGTGYSQRRSDLKILYDYYNGVIDESDYKYVLKPYGKSRKNFPSEMRNYPIIKPIIDLLLGEKSKRPLNYTVTVQNSDSINQKEEALNQQVFQALQQQFIQQVQMQQGESMEGAEQPELPQNIVNAFLNSYVDNRAIVGQNSLSYI